MMTGSDIPIWKSAAFAELRIRHEAAARADRKRWLIAAGNESFMIRYRCRAAANSLTLEDAGNYIAKLLKVEHEAAEWQAAMEALILVATSGWTDDVCAD